MAKAASSYELSCRAQAKDLAAESYRNCVTENKTAEIEKLRKSYQDRLRSLKDDYEKEVEQLGGKKSIPKKSEGNIVISKNIKLPKKSQNSSQGSQEVKVEIKQVPSGNSDESQMDIPEPIPVEN